MEFDFPGYLAELTHFELFEVYYLVRNALVSDVTVFMTVLFAYVTVSYFASAKLTRFQAISISALYSLFALYMVASAYTSSRMLSIVSYSVSGINSSWESVALVSILLIAWIFSIVLFLQTRRMNIT